MVAKALSAVNRKGPLTGASLLELSNKRLGQPPIPNEFIIEMV
jgi:hypothetical protein